MPVGGNFTNCNCGPDTTTCESPTEPLATVGLCLADGTPIAVTVVRDCAGAVTSEGWINLTTGAWSAGAPPAGTIACGDARSIQVSGVFCDVDPDGTVLGLVLIEYSYAADGSIDGVRLVDAVTGETYTPQGEVTTCPAGVEQPERDLLQLCDISDDESGTITITSTPFVRDYQRDETGAITGYTDYTLAGEPYTPAGTVGVCQPEPDQECQHCETLTLCDIVTSEESPGPGTELPWALVGVDPDPDSEPGQGFLFRLSPPDDPAQVATVRVTSNTVANTVCPPQTPGDLVFHNTNDLRFHLDPVAQEMSFVRVDLLDFDTFEPVQIHSDSPEPSRLGGTAVWNAGHTQIEPTESNGTGEMYWDSPPPEFGYRIWNTGGGTSCSQLSFAGVTLVFPEPPPGTGVATGFLRTVCRDCQGDIMSTVDTELDGTTAYVPVGQVGACGTGGGGGSLADTVNCDEGTALLVRVCASDESPGPEEPCRNGSSTLLCEYTTDDGDTSGEATATVIADADPFNGWSGYGQPTNDTWCQVNGPDDGLFTGGTKTFGPGSACADSSSSMHEVVAASLAAETGDCEQVDITVSVQVQLDGPNAGVGGDGVVSLWNVPRREQLASQRIQSAAPVGHTETITLTATVPGTALAAGEIAMSVDLETEHRGVKTWTANGFTATYAGTGCAVSTAFLRHTVTDCDGNVIAQTDTDLDGQPITVTGEVGQCTTAGGGESRPVRDAEVVQLCDVDDDESGTVEAVPFLRHLIYTDGQTPPTVVDTELDGVTPYMPAGEVGVCGDSGTGPEQRVDVESVVMCVRDTDGEITGQVVVERVYDDQTGDRVVQRLTDPTTGDEVTLPDGAELVLCNEPACPVAFSTECVGAVTRTEASYDNTSLIDGVPGQCGSVQGPGGQFPCQPASGGYTIVSWIVDGEEVIGEDSGRTFAGGPCGEGTPGNLGMHHNWGLALTNLDPSGATWTAQDAPGCAWFVGSTGGTQTVYGPMIVVDDDGQRWTLGPAQQCEETQYTKVYSQECDGTVSVSWLDAQGVPTEAPTGDLVPCGTGCSAGPGRGLDFEVIQLCDVGVEESPGEGPAAVPVPFLRHLIYGPDGEVATSYDTDLTGLTPYAPSGTVAPCGTAGEERPATVIDQCRCDDTDGDGVGDVDYVELLTVGADGTLISLGTYTDDLSAPYAPIAPVDCPTGGAPPAVTVQAHRVEVPPGGSWSADSVPLLQAVTLVAWAGDAQITTTDGTSTLHQGESASWSVARDFEAYLSGPLSVTTDSGTVTVTYTTGGTA